LFPKVVFHSSDAIHIQLPLRPSALLIFQMLHITASI